MHRVGRRSGHPAPAAADSAAPASTIINGTSGPDILRGTPYADSISGLAGDDVLDGGAGIDTMIGGTGNDLYFVDNASELITELLDEGSDRVVTSASITLPDHVDNAIYIGSADRPDTLPPQREHAAFAHARP